MTHDNILDKVRKILAKTTENGATDAEAQSAFLMAQKLLAKYGLDMVDVDAGRKESSDIEERCATHRYSQKFRRPLANVIAVNFRCQVLLSADKKHVSFIGHRTDVDVCVEVFNVAYEFIYREAWRRHNKVYAKNGAAVGVVNAYALGFISGLKSAFDSQSKALMVIVPQDVEDEVQRRTEGRTSSASFKLKKTDEAMRATREGYHDGKTFLNGTRVGTPQ